MCLRYTCHQIILGWKTYRYYYETDELPNPRPIQPKKSQANSGIWATFFLTANIFSWVGIGFIQETDYKKPNPDKFSANILMVFMRLVAVYLNCVSWVPMFSQIIGLINGFLLHDLDLPGRADRFPICTICSSFCHVGAAYSA